MTHQKGLNRFSSKGFYMKPSYQAIMKEKKQPQILGNQENNAASNHCTIRHRVEHRATATQVGKGIADTVLLMENAG